MTNAAAVARKCVPIFLVAAFALAAPAQAQKSGGSITVGQELEIAGFDPLKVGVYDTSTFTAAAAIFDTLTTLDEKGEAAPKLAVSWTHSDDYKSWTFKLRQGVKFHDGTPFNAQAFKENFDRQKDPANKCRCAFYITNVKEVLAPDEYTIVYNLTDPSVNLPAVITIQSSNNAIHSPTAWKTKGDDYNRNPVGTGPYILKSWTAGDRMVLEKNPDYWDKGRPYLDRIILKPLPDAQSRFASLQSGEADIIWDDENDADNIMRAQKDSKLTVHTYKGSGAQVYAFNTKVAPFDDVRVRQALVMAIDRPKMSQAISNGLSRPATNPYGDGSWVIVQGRRRAAVRHREGQGADQGLWQAGRVQDAGDRDAARPHDRPGAPAVLEARRRQHGDRAGRSGHHPVARLHPPVPVDAVAYRRSRRSRSADVCELSQRQSARAVQLR
ncbi:ABC transporter substrate-binding protein [Bradyrhizobium sp. C-145]|nr:ABC transporter substrate-binding protein [Bradyrhizobium sp. C-145]UQR65875.1 ABC transporter substrate-binding protein [Bradyrhizobium sp. C-145]